MKSFLTYSQFIAESVGSVPKIGDEIQLSGKPIRVVSVIKEIKNRLVEFIGMDSAGKTFRVKYNEVSDDYTLDEFEGSYDGSTQLASDLFLATQTAANGIAF